MGVPIRICRCPKGRSGPPGACHSPVTRQDTMLASQDFRFLFGRFPSSSAFLCSALASDRPATQAASLKDLSHSSWSSPVASHPLPCKLL